MTPTLKSEEGLIIDTGEVTENKPALVLIQKVNDGGDAKFSVLEIKLDNTTEDENAAFIRGFMKGVEAFSISSSGVFIGRSVQCSYSVVAGFSILSTDTLNLGANAFLTPDASWILALKRGQNAQTFRIYKTENTINGDAEYLSLNWTNGVAKIGTEKKLNGVERDLSIGVGASDTIKLSAGNKASFFGATPVQQPTLGAAIAGSTYSANEQQMLQKVYNALRALGLAS